MMEVRRERRCEIVILIGIRIFWRGGQRKGEGRMIKGVRIVIEAR